ncbi:MAG: ATP-binding protein [Chloroflexota bacterium]
MSLIHTIQIENFRGILAQRKLVLDGQSAIIIGENGAGKSSIVDALEYHLTGKIGRLSGTATINKKLAIPHLQADGNPKISLTHQNHHPVTTTYPKYAPRIPAPLRAWYQTENR